MTRQRYSIVEAVNRILRTLQNKAVPQDTPGTVSGEILSVNDALSDLAELVAGSLPGETFTLPNAVQGTITATGNISTAGDLSTEGNLSVTGSIVGEDFTARDSISARTINGVSIEAGTGTFYAGYGEVSIGGFSADALFGNGKLVLAIGPASTIPSGTLSHLGGVLFAQGGALKWLGASGTVTTLAGS